MPPGALDQVSPSGVYRRWTQSWLVGKWRVDVEADGILTVEFMRDGGYSISGERENSGIGLSVSGGTWELKENRLFLTGDSRQTVVFIQRNGGSFTMVPVDDPDGLEVRFVKQP